MKQKRDCFPARSAVAREDIQLQSGTNVNTKDNFDQKGDFSHEVWPSPLNVTLKWISFVLPDVGLDKSRHHAHLEVGVTWMP